MLLEINHVCKSFGAHDVLVDVSLRLGAGERVGLVGRNGCGKTTLLRILAGEEPADTGHARRSPPSLRVGYLPQAIRAGSGRTVREEVVCGGDAGAPWWGVEKVLSGLGFAAAQWDQRIASLSGGEKTRLSLAKILVTRPEVLLLDEPTNHLDIAMMQWVEDWLREFRGAAFIVSHDRRFLDATVHRIVELQQGRLTTYTGSYSAYAQQKELALRRQADAYREQQRTIRSIQEFVQRQLQQAARIQSGPKRGRDHFGRVSRKVAKRAQAGRRRLAHLDRHAVDKPREETRIRARFEPAERGGQDVIVAEGTGKSYGERTLWSGLSLYLRRGDRLAVVGRNGAGKTTLLRVLLGEEPPDSGTVRRGASVNVGYLAQEHESLDFERAILDEVHSVGTANQSDVRTLLACLLFRGEEVWRRIGDLSEGERVRVALAKLLVSGANLLVLDEPTNHLDIATRERLEAALDDYGGTIVLVSHDRYLLDRLSEETLVLDGGNATLYPGNYSYVEATRGLARS